MRPAPAFTLIGLLILVTRLCHWNVVWVEEAYPLAAAMEMLRGKLPYRDFWFDKPPLFPAFYAIFGAQTGVTLRIAGSLFILLCCWLAYRLAGRLWGRREGLIAASLLAFFLTFDFAPSVMALAPDLLMIAPHLAAILFAVEGRPYGAGAMCGLALLVNPKAVFVAAACLIWQWRSAHKVALGTAAVAAPAAILFGWNQWQQVYEWGFLYSSQALSATPWKDGLLRTASWAWFHAALIAAAAFALRRDLGLWAAISLAGALTGMRFFPRYYFQFLPAMTILAAGGMPRMSRKWWLAAALLIVPLARFGPRYPMVAAGEPWADLALHDDARQAALLLRRHNAASLLVWGYRPEIFAYSRVPAATRFLDSQPLTGVLADRHLVSTTAAAPEIARRNRQELIRTTPQFIADGLGPLNPALAITQYPDLAAWLAPYREVGRTAWTILYRREAP